YPSVLPDRLVRRVRRVAAARLVLTRHAVRTPYPRFYDASFATIPATYWFPRSCDLSLEMRAQLQHRLVMGAADGLRIDVERGGDLGHVHFAVIEHRQDFALARREQRFRQLEL